MDSSHTTHPDLADAAASQHIYNVTPASGAAFGVFFKLLAIGMAAGIALWFAYLYQLGRFGDAGLKGIGLLLVGVAMVLYFAWHIARSRCSVDEQAIEQTWMWQRRYLLADVVFIKLLGVRSLDWLVAPRAYLRLADGKFAFVYFSGAPLRTAFEQLTQQMGERLVRDLSKK
jgi:hypothetical protein